MQLHNITADVMLLNENSIVVSFKESEIPFDDIIFLIKYSDATISNNLLIHLRLNANYISFVDFKQSQITFDFESKSQRDYWAKQLSSI